jgi:beta-xylosidase
MHRVVLGLKGGDPSVVSNDGRRKLRNDMRYRKSCIKLVFVLLVAFVGIKNRTLVQASDTQQWPFSNTMDNPIFWNDLPDIDIIRVNNTFYYSASSNHFSPGAPILRSYNLVDWEYVSHSVPVLDFGPEYDLDGGQAYNLGIWASSLAYRASNDMFYWIGCMRTNLRTYVFTASSAQGPWKKHSQIGTCYYDASLLIDDDDTLYVAHGSTNISIAQLSHDGISEAKVKSVYNSTIGYIEGSRFYKINGKYYIFLTRPTTDEFVLKSTNGPWGPYHMQPVSVNATAPVPGAGAPHQGGIVSTSSGDWYYMAFVDCYPGGRIPVMAPLLWNADGWPVLKLNNNTWGLTYPFPDVPSGYPSVKSALGIENFSSETLQPDWEWNHNPDNTNWYLRNGLYLQTATVTNDFYKARNTLTRRILGPKSIGIAVLDISTMRDGDISGLALMRDNSAWIGVHRDEHATKVAMINNVTMNNNHTTVSFGTEIASAEIPSRQIWLRLAVDIRPGTHSPGHFSYSLDGKDFHSLGNEFIMKQGGLYNGYRYGIFNYATKALGGVVKVQSFEISVP